MNFQAVAQANGQNVTMFGTFNEVGGVSFTQNQKQVCKCQIIDDNNEKHLVRLYGTMPGPALLGQRQQFTLSTYSGKTQQGQPYTGYSGFWDDKAQVAPQNPQQPPSQPAQPTNAPYNALHSPQSYPQGMKMPDTYAYPVTPETQERMAASVACQCAARLFGTAPDNMPTNEAAILLIQIAEPIKNWILNSKPQYKSNPDWVGENPPPPKDDEIPY